MPENQGRLSPFTSSSGQQDEQSDNFVEYYSKPSGGEEKMLDVNSSNTVDRGYEHSTSTEPDPTGSLAMNKSFDGAEWEKTRDSIREFSKAMTGNQTYTKPVEQEGAGTYSVTANTTLDAPAPGQTTEPSSVHKAAGTCNCNCEKCMKCAGMTKADDEPELEKAACDCCADCGSDCKGDCCDKCKNTSKADEAEDLEKADKPESEETDADEPDDDADDKKESVKKSSWANAFAPGVPTAALRTVFRVEE